MKNDWDAGSMTLSALSIFEDPSEDMSPVMHVGKRPPHWTEHSHFCPMRRPYAGEIARHLHLQSRPRLHHGQRGYGDLQTWILETSLQYRTVP